MLSKEELMKLKEINQSIADEMFEKRLSHLRNQLGMHHRAGVNYFNEKAVDKWEKMQHDFKYEFNKKLEEQLRLARMIENDKTE